MGSYFVGATIFFSIIFTPLAVVTMLAAKLPGTDIRFKYAFASVGLFIASIILMMSRGI